MLRNSTASSLQKTVKSNEAEALRSWRSALDAIYYHNAYRVSPHYRAKNQTEKALQDSLKDMEMQCKERVDLLDALRKSREEGAQSGKSMVPGLTPATLPDTRPANLSTGSQPGWLGQGTIPAVNYSDLSPQKAPKLPDRPPISTARSASSDGRKSYISSQSQNVLQKGPLTPATLPVPHKPSRSPSPEKKGGLRTTLRSGKEAKRMSRAAGSSDSRRGSGPAASKAATQAWDSRSKLGPNRPGENVEDEEGTSRSNSLSGAAASSHASNPRKPSFESNRESPMDRRGIGIVRPPSPSDFIPKRTAPQGGRPSGSYFPEAQHQQINGYPKTDSLVSEVPDLSSLDGSLPVHQQNPCPAPPPKRRPKSPVRYDDLDSDPVARQTKAPQASSQRTAKSNESPYAPYRPQTRMLPTRTRSPQKPQTSPDDPAGSISRRPVAGNPKIRTKYDNRRPRNSKDGARSDDNPLGTDPTKNLPKHDEEELDVSAPGTPSSPSSDTLPQQLSGDDGWSARVDYLMNNLPKGVDETAAKQIFNEIVVKGDEVHWSDVAGLDAAKNALKEAVVYPFLRPDLFMGLREPARGMLLFGPPGTGKTMLARAVATESRSTFFAISASSLTSKFLGESEKLVRALFSLAKALAPSIIFVDEIDSLLSTRSGSGEHEATRRIKTEFLIQWSDLQRAAAGREQSEKEKIKGDASRVLVLAATNLPWAIDEAARRRFVRRQYIPLPEGHVRGTQLRTLLGHQKHGLSDEDISRLIGLTDGFSGSDITALAKDAAMGPLRSLGEALLHMSMDQIRPIGFADFEASLVNIRPSVSKQGLKEFEDWAQEFGERGG
ncbi:MAG: hypothetical protein M1833_005090 [Piccolia ochrophora]|nr:MAG: hypothetical protein M1833_005090 [Piccolia ochrophora]